MARWLYAATAVVAIALTVLGCRSDNGGAATTASEDLGQTPEAAVSAEETAPLEAGDRVPTARVKDMEGRALDLSRLVAERPSVIIFYRGGWCPYCTTHLGALATIEQRLVELGYHILAISPEPPPKVAETGEEGGFRYQLLSDNATEAARGFGVAFKVDEETAQRYRDHGIELGTAPGSERRVLPVPSVFIAGSDGLVTFAYANPDYRVRLEPEEIIEAAEAAIE